MSRSSVYDGSKFTLGLESLYRGMWRRYYKGYVPSLKRMELLQQQGVCEATPVKHCDPTRIAVTVDSLPESVKVNGFDNTSSSSMVNHSSEENVNQESDSVESHYKLRQADLKG